MSNPTSLRLPDRVKARLDRSAARSREKPATLAVRLIDEGIRMHEHLGVALHDSPTRGRVACLAGGPDIAEVIDVLTGLDARGDERITGAAAWLGTHPSQVRGYASPWATTPRSATRSTTRSTCGRRKAAELRSRYAAEQALLG